MTSIDVLPDDILLAIFDYYLVAQDVGRGPSQPFRSGETEQVEVWQSLVHVCRRWRIVAFGSPCRLNLRLFCTSKTPARDMLDIWPALPILVRSRFLTSLEQKGVDNIVAALERSDRVREIGLTSRDESAMGKVWAAMQEPFPQLTSLRIEHRSHGEMATVLTDSFLGGSAECLRELWLERIPFPGLPKLLLSATHLVDLHLTDIPHPGYISPEAMATALSTLTNLESLFLGFQSPQSRLDRESRRPPPLTRSVLPLLTSLSFKGDNVYIDDLVTRIDAPRLNDLVVTFFNDIVFDTPQFVQFIIRTPGLKALENAHVYFFGHLRGDTATVSLSSPPSGNGKLEVNVRCKELDWQVSSMKQVCTSCLPPLSTLEGLYLGAPGWRLHRQDNTENELWLELLHPFTTVKNLYLTEKIAPRIVPALQELVGGRVTEVLPTLQNIFLDGLQPSGALREGVEKFVAARQGPIVVSRWERYQDHDD